MGLRYSDGEKRAYHTLGQNLKNVDSTPINKDGHFGRKGNGAGVRVVQTDSP